MKLKFCAAGGTTGRPPPHHLITRGEGGSNDQTNLITLCYGCHSKLHERWSSGVCNASRRPRTGLQAAKGRGAKLGGLRAKGIRMRGEANARAEALRPILESLAGLPANATRSNSTSAMHRRRMAAAGMRSP